MERSIEGVSVVAGSPSLHSHEALASDDITGIREAVMTGGKVEEILRPPA